MGVKDDDGDLTVAQDRQLIGLLHQTKLSFGESNLSVPFIRDPGYLYLFTPHSTTPFTRHCDNLKRSFPPKQLCVD